MVEQATADGSPDTESTSDSESSEGEETPDAVSEEGENSPNELVDKISESLSDDGFGVFHGREFITIREDGQLAPNSTVVEQYLEGTEAAMLAYNDSANEIAIIPLEQNYDRGDVYAYQAGNTQTISARGFLKNNDIMPDETIRYTPEWDDDLGGEHIDGGFRIDLDQDGEVVTIDSSDENPTDDSDDTTATPDR
jgi:hypothetical protein